MASVVYYVEGNHEQEIDQVKALTLFAGQGVRGLHKEVLEARGPQLIGLN